MCVLERGRPYPPGSFRQDPRGLAANLWDPTVGFVDEALPGGGYERWPIDRALLDSALVFRPTIATDDTDAVISDPVHVAGAVG